MNGQRNPLVGLVGGGMLFVLGVLLLAQTTGLIPEAMASWTGTAVLGTIGLGFVAMYVTAPARWWAIIPAGTMLSLAVVTAVEPFVPGAVSGAIVLFGIATTFAAVALLPTDGRTRTWAWMPAAVMAVLGLMTLGAVMPVAAAFWPVLLIIGGAYLVLAWTMTGRRGGGHA